MANIYWDKVLIPLKNLLRSEFGKSFNIYIGEEFVKKGNSSIRLYCTGSSLNDEYNYGQTRIYNIELTYYMSAVKVDENVMKKLYNDIGRIETVCFNNRNYTDYWFNGQVSDVDVKTMYDEDEIQSGNVLAGVLYYNVSHMANL